MDECLLDLWANWCFIAVTGVWGCTIAVPCLQFVPFVPIGTGLKLPTEVGISNWEEGNDFPGEFNEAIKDPEARCRGLGAVVDKPAMTVKL